MVLIFVPTGTKPTNTTYHQLLIKGEIPHFSLSAAPSPPRKNLVFRVVISLSIDDKHLFHCFLFILFLFLINLFRYREFSTRPWVFSTNILGLSSLYVRVCFGLCSLLVRVCLFSIRYRVFVSITREIKELCKRYISFCI